MARATGTVRIGGTDVAAVAAERRLLVSPLAGNWYPDDPRALRAQLQGFWDSTVIAASNDWRAVILPHAGYGDRKSTRLNSSHRT